MYEHRRPTIRRRIVQFCANVRRMGATAFIGPCGHDCQGDERSWWCPTCGSSGSSSG